MKLKLQERVNLVFIMLFLREMCLNCVILNCNTNQWKYIHRYYLSNICISIYFFVHTYFACRIYNYLSRREQSVGRGKGEQKGNSPSEATEATSSVVMQFRSRSPTARGLCEDNVPEAHRGSERGRRTGESLLIFDSSLEAAAAASVEDENRRRHHYPSIPS